MLLSHVLKFNLCVQFMLYVVQPHINGINFACCSRRFGPRTWYFSSERCSGSFGCFLFITSSRPASPSPTSPRPHVPESPSPTSPRPRVPVSPRPTSWCPRVLASQVPRPRPTFSHSPQSTPVRDKTPHICSMLCPTIQCSNNVAIIYDDFKSWIHFIVNNLPCMHAGIE